MERFATNFFRYKKSKVLILIIMEDTHGGYQIFSSEKSKYVLILIIMEDTHGESRHISP